MPCSAAPRLPGEPLRQLQRRCGRSVWQQLSWEALILGQRRIVCEQLLRSFANLIWTRCGSAGRRFQHCEPAACWTPLVKATPHVVSGSHAGKREENRHSMIHIIPCIGWELCVGALIFAGKTLLRNWRVKSQSGSPYSIDPELLFPLLHQQSY